MGLKTLGHFQACQLLLRAQCFGDTLAPQSSPEAIPENRRRAVNHVIVGCDLFSSLFERTMSSVSCQLPSQSAEKPVTVCEDQFAGQASNRDDFGDDGRSEFGEVVSGDGKPPSWRISIATPQAISLRWMPSRVMGLSSCSESVRSGRSNHVLGRWIQWFERMP